MAAVVVVEKNKNQAYLLKRKGAWEAQIK